VWYYIIFDPQQLIQEDVLRIYQMSLGRYIPKDDRYLEEVGLGVTLWDGIFEGMQAQWLRWCDLEGNLIPTGEEGRNQERQRAEQERQRAERLAAQLRAMGVEPDEG
jgi:hypothetical protein